MAAGSFTTDITAIRARIRARARARQKTVQGPVIRSSGENREEEHADDLVDLLGA